MSPVVLAVVGVFVLLVLLALVVVTRYKVAGPSEAFIVTGRRGKTATDPETGRVFTDNSGQKVVVGGGVFVVPFVQQRFTLDLSSRHIPVAVRGAVTCAASRPTSKASRSSRSAAPRTRSAPPPSGS